MAIKADDIKKLLQGSNVRANCEALEQFLNQICERKHLFGVFYSVYVDILSAFFARDVER
jgi:hypothetical protein